MKKILCGLLALSLAAFAVDLGHMLYHLWEEPALWRVEDVPLKFLFKVIIFLIPLTLLFFKSAWTQLLLVLFVLFSAQSSAQAAWTRPACEHARELLEQAGTARDAKEDFLGRVKRDPPYGTFPSDMDQISWWGTFKPFEFWQSPEFQAVWINPEGAEVARQTFRGNKCRLAKTTIQAKDQPRGEFPPGMWKVIVTCEDYVIDRRPFAVLPAKSMSDGSDNGAAQGEQAMIWAQDLLE